jgi:Flp pilus assembly protein TadD
LEELAQEPNPPPLVEAAIGRKILRSNPSSSAIAVQHLRRAIKLGFEIPTVYEDLAAALVLAGVEAEAIAPLQRAVELFPYTPVLHKSLALRYINLQRYKDARETLEHYVELFPEDDFVRKLLLSVGTTRPPDRR